MANGMGLVDEGLWRRDRDFKRVPRLAQCTFVQVLSQKDLDTAGVLTLNLELLVKACEELTEQQLREDFAALEVARFLFVDFDTHEILIRSYVRRVSVKNGNAWKSVPKNARMIASEKIRHELACELRRIDRKDARDLADEIDPVTTPSGPGSDPVLTPSEPSTPSRPRPDPPSKDKSSNSQRETSVVGSVGEGPRPECPDHEENSDGPCIHCRRRRKWDEANAERLAADELEAKRRAREARENCSICKGTNWVPHTEPAVRCNHQEASNA